MIYVRVINENGIFIEDAFVSELTEFTIEKPCPSGFCLPKWNGETWEEGAPQEYIDNLKAQAIPAEPTLEERVALHDTKIVTLEETIDALYGGI